jgi:hypothetical protein
MTTRAHAPDAARDASQRRGHRSRSLATCLAVVASAICALVMAVPQPVSAAPVVECARWSVRTDTVTIGLTQDAPADQACPSPDELSTWRDCFIDAALVSLGLDPPTVASWGCGTDVVITIERDDPLADGSVQPGAGHRPSGQGAGSETCSTGRSSTDPRMADGDTKAVEANKPAPPPNLDRSAGDHKVVVTGTVDPAGPTPLLDVKLSIDGIPAQDPKSTIEEKASNLKTSKAEESTELKAIGQRIDESIATAHTKSDTPQTVPSHAEPTFPPDAPLNEKKPSLTPKGTTTAGMPVPGADDTRTMGCEGNTLLCGALGRKINPALCSPPPTHQSHQDCDPTQALTTEDAPPCVQVEGLEPVESATTHKPSPDCTKAMGTPGGEGPCGATPAPVEQSTASLPDPCTDALITSDQTCNPSGRQVAGPAEHDPGVEPPGGTGPTGPNGPNPGY